jgi:hypothetical protein
VKAGGQRTKGHTFERWFARWFKEQFFDLDGDAKRGWQSRGGGKEEADVETFAKGSRLAIHWELCHGKAPSPWAKFAQAMQDKDPEDRPIVIVKRNRGEPMVFMRLSDFRPFLDAYIREFHHGED